ncbi:MAG: class I SAM-dependent methyltransferase [Parvibaculum sp.]|nr:class I SAM-dependent methyltransferase [Parvibaculum sp.]
MSNSSLVNLATVGSDELQAMPVDIFTSGLEHMSAEAIVRFRRLRKLSAKHRTALEKFLVEHPEKRPGGGAADSGSHTKSPSGGADAKADKLKKPHGEAGRIMEFLLCVIAWWEGMETDDVAKAKGITRRPRKKKAAAARKPDAPQPPAHPSAPAALSTPAALPPPLSRVELVQRLWGNGFSLPGGADFAIRVAAPADFKPDGRYLDLAPGLGGGMRAVARAHGITLLGVEPDEELAAVAQSFSDAAGMSETASVRAGPADFDPANGYAAIFMREAMFTEEERERILTSAAHALTDGGSLVLTDFVLADSVGTESPESEAVAHWRAAEPHGAFPLKEAEYRTLFADQDYKLDRFDDLTAEYLPLIQAGLRQFHDCLQNAKLPPETATTLIREGSIWLARSQALETGQLRLVHIHAVRMPASPAS